MPLVSVKHGVLCAPAACAVVQSSDPLVHALFCLSFRQTAAFLTGLTWAGCLFGGGDSLGAAQGVAHPVLQAAPRREQLLRRRRRQLCRTRALGRHPVSSRRSHPA